MNCIKIHNSLPKEAAEIRQKVFVEEQKFENEFDDIDKNSLHFVLYKDGIAAGTARMFTEDGGKTYQIGRVAVLPQYRKYRLGSEIMNAALKKAAELGGKTAVHTAQCRVKHFYESLGFSASGDVYYDEYCQHVHMEKLL